MRFHYSKFLYFLTVVKGFDYLWYGAGLRISDVGLVKRFSALGVVTPSFFQIIYLVFSTMFIGASLFLLSNNSKALKFLVFGLYCFLLLTPSLIGGGGGAQDFVLAYALFFCVFIGEDGDRNHSKDRIFLRLIQYSILSGYFSAGLSKCVGIWHSLNFEEIVDSLPNQMASIYAMGFQVSNPAIDLLIRPELRYFVFLGFALVILLELAAIIPVFYSTTMRTFGYLFSIFHVVSMILLDHHFMPMPALDIIFLILAEGASSNQLRTISDVS